LGITCRGIHLRASVNPARNCIAALLGMLLVFCVCARAYAQSTAPPPSQSPAVQSQVNDGGFVVNGDVETPLSLSLSDLSGLPRETLKVTNEHSGKDETYQGVPVTELLKRAGVPQGHELRGAAMTTYVRAQGADGYSVTFSLAELDPSIQDSDVIVADTLNGEPIPGKLGPLRLVAPHDKRPARWVSMLRSLTVVKISK
jgi:DMSO/TMAO reductase YedYZ molybdopterin-dependent catalytic subunit